MRKTFQQFMTIKEAVPGSSPEDEELMKNPKLLAGNNPQNIPTVQKAILTKRQNPTVSLAAAMKAVQMQPKTPTLPGQPPR